MVLAQLGSDLKAYILEATRAWHAQHEFADVIKFSSDTEITFSQGLQQKSNLSSFQSLAPRLFWPHKVPNLSYIGCGAMVYCMSFNTTIVYRSVVFIEVFRGVFGFFSCLLHNGSFCHR